jgi:hypothetical protein
MNIKELSRIEHFRQFKKQIRGNDSYLIIGIDIAKDKHRAFFGTANGRVILRVLIFENSAQGFEKLLTRVQFYMDRDGFGQVAFGLEPTSVYHKPLAEHLIKNQYLVVYVTNEAINKNRSLLDGRWDKNDTKDAANVADLLSQAKCHYYDLPDIRLRDIRSLLLLRKRLKKQLHSSRMRIRNNLVAQYFRKWIICGSKLKQKIFPLFAGVWHRRKSSSLNTMHFLKPSHHIKKGSDSPDGCVKSGSWQMNRSAARWVLQYHWKPDCWSTAS